MSDLTGASQGPNTLRPNSLGLIAVTFMVISAAAPLTGVAGAMPIAFLLGNGAGIPATFLFMTLVMLAFAVGYVAMSRHVVNAGAFYAYAARALGGRAGGAVALVALVAYNCMFFGLTGMFGAIAAGVFAGFGLDLPWWVWSLCPPPRRGVRGYREVALSARVLIAIVALEYAIVLLVDFLILSAGGGPEGLALNIFDPDAIFSGSLTIAILMCMGSFIGFEATTIYAEEARDPARTIPRATYLSVLMIGVFYVFTTWLMAVGAGAATLPQQIGALDDPSEFYFGLVAHYAGETAAMITGLLVVTSLFAALSAFHNYIARYSYVAGREGLLPAPFGRTHARHQSPHVGSLVQTICALAVVALFAGLGLDPLLNLFTWIAQIGTLGVLGMMTVTSVSVMVFFRRAGTGESALKTQVLPALSGLVIAALFVFIFVNYGDLTGTAGVALAVILPSLVPLAAAVGWWLAARLEARDPTAFAQMGQNRV